METKPQNGSELRGREGRKERRQKVKGKEGWWVLLCWLWELLICCVLEAITNRGRRRRHWHLLGRYYWCHTVPDVLYTCNSQRVGKGAPRVAGNLEVGVQILQDRRAQLGQGDIARGAWGVLGKTHIQGVVGEAQRHPGVEDQNLDPHQGALDQTVLVGKYPDTDLNRLADL